MRITEENIEKTVRGTGLPYDIVKHMMICNLLFEYHLLWGDEGVNMLLKTENDEDLIKAAKEWRQEK